jgi:NAD(P)H-dependent FMN reductase
VKIAIITGSTRPGRKNETVAQWAYELARQRPDADFELVDIKDYHLPLLDEPSPGAPDATSSLTQRRGRPRLGSLMPTFSLRPNTTTAPRRH